TETNAGLYNVLVGDACGDSLIYSVSLTVNQPITVVGAPLSLTNCLGTPAEFLISATGSGLYYQWFHGTNALPEQTNSSVTLTNVTAASAGIYRVVAGDACGNLLTNTASLTVLPPPTASILLPTNGAVYLAPADFAIVANAEETGGTIESVQFFSNGGGLGLV